MKKTIKTLFVSVLASSLVCAGVLSSKKAVEVNADDASYTLSFINPKNNTNWAGIANGWWDGNSLKDFSYDGTTTTISRADDTTRYAALSLLELDTTKTYGISFDLRAVTENVYVNIEIMNNPYGLLQGMWVAPSEEFVTYSYTYTFTDASSNISFKLTAGTGAIEIQNLYYGEITETKTLKNGDAITSLPISPLAAKEGYTAGWLVDNADLNEGDTFSYSQNKIARPGYLAKKHNLNFVNSSINQTTTTNGWWGDYSNDGTTTTITRAETELYGALAVGTFDTAKTYYLTFDLEVTADLYINIEILEHPWSLLLGAWLHPSDGVKTYAYTYTFNAANDNIRFRLSSGTGSLKISNFYYGEIVSTQSLATGASISSLPDSPLAAKEGYTAGWGVDGKYINSGDAYSYSEDKVAYPQYKANEYTLTFGDTGNTSTVTYNQPIGELPTLEQEEGYDTYWAIDDVEIKSDTIYNWAANKTATVKKVAERYDLTFVADGTTVSTSKVGFGDKIGTLPEVPHKTGYNGCWKIDGTEVNSETIYSWAGNKTATAEYTVKRIKITFNDADGNLVEEFTRDYGVSIDGIPVVPTVKGKKNGRWVIGDTVVTDATKVSWEEDVVATATYDNATHVLNVLDDNELSRTNIMTADNFYPAGVTASDNTDGSVTFTCTTPNGQAMSKNTKNIIAGEKYRVCATINTTAGTNIVFNNTWTEDGGLRTYFTNGEDKDVTWDFVAGDGEATGSGSRMDVQLSALGTATFKNFKIYHITPVTVYEGEAVGELPTLPSGSKYILSDGTAVTKDTVFNHTEDKDLYLAPTVTYTGEAISSRIGRTVDIESNLTFNDFYGYSNPTYTYEWLKEGSDTRVTTPTEAGNYTIYVKATGSFGITSSEIAISATMAEKDVEAPVWKKGNKDYTYPDKLNVTVAYKTYAMLNLEAYDAIDGTIKVTYNYGDTVDVLNRFVKSGDVVATATDLTGNASTITIHITVTNN